MSSRRLFPLLLACCGFVLASSAPLCPCPDDKWQPPFRPSQVLYSEFPEDRGRSLDIDRKDISRKGYPLAPAPPYSYDPPPNNHLPGDPAPRDYSDDYPEGGGGGGGEKDYPDKDYPLSYSSSGLGGPPRDYPDYGNSASREEPVGSPEYSSESSHEAYKQYSSYDDYRDDKSKEAEESERDFTLEDFELDPEVVVPYATRNKSSNPPPSRHRPSQGDSPPPRIRPSQDDPRPHDEVHEPTEPPNTQLEIPATQPSSSIRHPTPIPIQATGYPLTRTPVPVFRNPALSLMTPNQAGWGHWKDVLEQAELSNLQVMKPPPLGQAQTWGRVSTNYASGSPKLQQYAKRPPHRYP
uniref:Translation initiation factor IF-2 n=1 Tax=Lygus hesperus TaxID=30085 RepID=A0A0K8TFL7_LYGHE